MDFVFTEEFYSAYDDLDDEGVLVVDEMIRRLLIDHASGWARQGRIEGEKGGLWIITMTGPNLEGALYWEYHTGELILLVALVVRDQ